MQNLKLNLSSNFDNNLLSYTDYEEDSTPAGFVLTAIVAHAQSFNDVVSGNAPLLKTTSANNTDAPAERVPKAPSKALMHKLSVPKDEKHIFDPEGEAEDGFFGFFYTMALWPRGELVRCEFPKGVRPQT